MWSQWEEEVLVLTNERRAAGADCGSEGAFPPAPPLTMNPALRCAARVHSMDMAVRNYFDHTDPDGVGFDQRIVAAGYNASAMGENIAAGPPDPEHVVEAWMGSDGHCSNIMQSFFTEIGIGYYYENEKPNNYWTQDFGRSF